jgi:hypothetical protein
MSASPHWREAPASAWRYECLSTDSISFENGPQLLATIEHPPHVLSTQHRPPPHDLILASLVA